MRPTLPSADNRLEGSHHDSAGLPAYLRSERARVRLMGHKQHQDIGMHRSFFKFPLASLIVLAASASAQNPPAAATSTLGVQFADPLLQTAEVMPLAEHSLLLDLARSGERLVAVGERGHVLMSSDGKTWTQSANVPVRSALTAVSAVGADVWAVGHDGIILHSGNAGETWEIQRRDPRGAAIAAAGGKWGAKKIVR